LYSAFLLFELVTTLYHTCMRSNINILILNHIGQWATIWDMFIEEDMVLYWIQSCDIAHLIGQVSVLLFPLFIDILQNADH